MSKVIYILQYQLSGQDLILYALVSVSVFFQYRISLIPRITEKLLKRKEVTGLKLQTSG